MRSPAAYRAIEESGIVSLPSLRSVKRQLQQSYPIDHGVDDLYLREERDKMNCASAEGVLVFDEVKLIGKICWNSKTHSIAGELLFAK